VLEVYPDGDVAKIEVSRRQLLRSSAGLRLRDIRSVDPALWVTNSAPALLVRDQAILLNFGSLRAIATPQSVLVFDYKSVGAQAFMAALLPRLRAANNGPSPIMPFELEVVFCLEVWHHLSHAKNYKEMHWIHAHIPISCTLS
jgi:magnesium transporter